MTILAEERPFAAVVHDEHLGTICSSCFSTKEDLFRCTGCRVLHYCSEQCQTLDWANHELECLCLQRCPLNVPSSICRLIGRIAFKLQRAEHHEPAFNGRFYEELAHNRAETLKRPKRSCAAVSQALHKFMGEKFSLKPSLILSIYCKVVANSFTIWEVDDAIGQGIYIGLSVHAQSCTPDAYVYFNGVKAILHSSAMGMKYSKDLLVSYVHKSQKQDDWLYTYHFKCSCSRCLHPSLVYNLCQPRITDRVEPVIDSSANSSSPCCPDSYRILDSVARQMTCYKCGATTPLVGDEETNESLVEPKIEEPEEMDELPEESKEPSPGNPLDQILQQLKEDEDGNIEIKTELYEENQEDADAVTAPHMVQDVPFSILPHPYEVRKIVIRSNESSTYSPLAPLRFMHDLPTNAATHRYEREMTAAETQPRSKGFSIARRSVSDVFLFNRPLVPKRTYLGRGAVYSRPNTPLDIGGHLVQQNDMGPLPHTKHYVMKNGQRNERPKWSYVHIIAVCILCSHHGYVNTQEVYNFIELYFPYYNTHVSRSYRYHLRDTLSRICDKFLVDDHCATAPSWTLRASLLEVYKHEINQFIQHDCASIGVNEFFKLIYSINWNRPAILTDDHATNLRAPQASVIYQRQAITRFNDRPAPSSYGQFSRQSSSSSSCLEATPVDNMVKNAAYIDQEYEVYRPDKIDDPVEFPKPEWKLHQMLTMAILSSENQCGTVQEMCPFICKFFPYFATTKHWRPSARTTLCSSKYFDTCRPRVWRNIRYKLLEDKVESTVAALHAWMCTKEARIGVQNFDILKELVDIKHAPHP